MAVEVITPAVGDGSEGYAAFMFTDGLLRAVGRSRHHRIRRVEIGVIENVEKFGAELQVEPFGKDELLWREIRSSQEARSLQAYFRPALPYVAGSGGTKAAGLKYSFGPPSITGPVNGGFQDGRTGLRLSPSFEGL